MGIALCLHPPVGVLHPCEVSCTSWTHSPFHKIHIYTLFVFLYHMYPNVQVEYTFGE